MKVTELKYEAVINLGNYESERVGVTVALEDGDQPVAILQDMIKFAKSKGSVPLAANKVMDSVGLVKETATTTTEPSATEAPVKKPKKDKVAAPRAEPTKEADAPKAEEESTEESAEEATQETKAEDKTAPKKRVKNTVYSRSNDIHKKAFTDMLTVVYPGWKKEADRFKAASEKLEGEEFLSSEAEVIPEFKDKLAKIIGVWKPS